MNTVFKRKENRIIVSGYGMPGVTSVATVLLTGKYFLNERLAVTIDYERTSKRIWGRDLVIYDLGCQTAFLDRFTGELSEFIFQNTVVLIYVIDSFDFFLKCYRLLYIVFLTLL